MAKYGVNYYGATKYGALTKLVYSVEPMTALVLDFSRVYLSWQTPRGTFSRVRLLRNQSGFPETAEDGVILFDEFATEGTVSRSYVIDSKEILNTIPFVTGRQAYYRFFIFTGDKVWRTAGSIVTLIPADHTTHEQFMGTLPRVYTTPEQSPLGSISTDSAIYRFIEGLSFTQDEFMTYLDLLRPTHTGLETPYQLIPLGRNNVGLTPEPALPIKNQKRLIREAIYMYSRKGTQLSLGTYVESLTGFNPTITVSENLLLSVQDSTFYQGLGNWVFTNATATVSEEQVPAPGVNVIDEIYTCKLIATGALTMDLGLNSPITKGVPVLEATEYIASCKVKSPPSSGNVTMKIKWYDRTGTLLSSSTGSSVSANNTWKSGSITATSPTGAVYAGLEITSNASGTYYVDQVCMQTGSAVSYDEARAVDVFLSPTKTNFIANPSFETNVTDSWTLSGLATAAQDASVSDIAYSGNKSAKVVATGNWSFSSNAIPIGQGVYYTASGLIKATSNLTVTFVGRNSDGDIVETTDTFSIGTAVNWSQFMISHLTDAFDINTATYEVVFSGGAGTFYLDCIQFEQANQASDYFDGSLPSDFGAVWDNTAHNSYTYLYPNKLQKVARLGQTIDEWLPSNCFWRLRTYAGLEYHTLTV